MTLLGVLIVVVVGTVVVAVHNPPPAVAARGPFTKAPGHNTTPQDPHRPR